MLRRGAHIDWEYDTKAVRSYRLAVDKPPRSERARPTPITPDMSGRLAFVTIALSSLRHKWGAIILILLGLAAIAPSFLLKGEWSPVSTTVLRRSGDILAFSALTWVVAHAVYV
jgi:hypothetical protein